MVLEAEHQQPRLKLVCNTFNGRLIQRHQVLCGRKHSNKECTTCKRGIDGWLTRRDHLGAESCKELAIPSGWNARHASSAKQTQHITVLLRITRFKFVNEQRRFQEARQLV